MKLPFSDRSKPWEYQAQQLRRLAEVRPDELLDPQKLAPKVGLRIVEALFVLQGFLPEDAAYLLDRARDCWSGGVFPVPLDDGTRICILNPQHSRRRNKITLMEEIAHIHLGHKPTALQMVADGLRVRGYDQEQEHEAYGVGAAALIPWESFFALLNRGTQIGEMAETYDVTPELVTYRVKITGAHNLYRSRQNRRPSVARPGRR